MSPAQKDRQKAESTEEHSSDEISQEELYELFHISGLIETQAETTLIGQIREAILDSGKLSLHEWKSLRDRLREIEELVPHIDLIIKLKEFQRQQQTSRRKS